jgi:hypothetical protein
LGLLSKRNLTRAATDYAPMLLGMRIPGFIKIHLRYIFSNPFIWAVLFLAPFVIGLVTLFSLAEMIPDLEISGWQSFLIVLFLIAMSLYFAERNRIFRKIYVRALPTMVIANGVMIYLFDSGPIFGRIVVFCILALFPAWVLGKLSTGMGYRMLSNGADRHYRPGRDLYMDAQYDEAFLHLEPSAKRGHMKSLYQASAKKGYGRAQTAFETLCEAFDEQEREAFQNDLTISGINDLF